MSKNRGRTFYDPNGPEDWIEVLRPDWAEGLDLRPNWEKGPMFKIGEKEGL